jgi:plasmid stabilization system protein ParE
MLSWLASGAVQNEPVSITANGPTGPAGYLSLCCTGQSSRRSSFAWTGYDHFRFLAANPLAGELRTDIGPTVRLFSVGSYMIVYRPDKQAVVIAHVVHGARDPNALLAPPT